MKSQKSFFLTALSIFLSLTVLVGIYLFLTQKLVFSSPPTPTAIVEPPKNPVLQGATQIAPVIPIPTIELQYLYNRDLGNLQAYLDRNAGNWLNISLNIHSMDTFGVAVSAEKVEGVACGGNTLDDMLCRYALIEYTSIYKGVVTGGVDSDFILQPQIALKEDWSEIARVTEGNKEILTMASTVIVTYSGYSCITSVEEMTPSPLSPGEVPPTDRSYTIKTLDERRLWPDLGPYLFPTGINEEYLRLDAERKAKAVALNPDRLAPILDYVAADLQPGGKLRQELEAFYSPDTAKAFGVKGFETVIQLLKGDLNTRCDGTPVLK